jgi:shikimate dehydrogenase
VGLEGAERERATPGFDLDALRLAPEGLREGQLVVDLVYGSNETELARTARKRGAIVVEGLEVLIRQGAASFRIWTGLDAPLDVMREAAKA